MRFKEKINNKIFKASTLVILGFGVSQVIRLASNLILTRLLSPDSFGIISIAFVIQTGLYLFSDIGFKPLVIRSPRSGESSFINTIWSAQIVRSVIMLVITLIISYPASIIYQEPILFAILPAIGAINLIEGCVSSSVIILEKEIRQKELITIEFFSQVLATMCMILVAYITRNIWSLTVFGFVSAVIKLIWSHKINKNFPNKICFEREAIRELVQFGKWILISTALYFLSSQIDKLLLGRFMGMKLFGIYNIALIFAELPKNVIEKVSSSILFPVVSNYKKEEMREAIKKTRMYILFISAPLLAFFCCFSDFVILFLYDVRYHQAAWMLPLLAFGIWPRLLVLSIDRCLLSIGRPKSIAVGNFVKFIYMIIVLPLSFYFFGLFGAVIAVALNDIPLYITINWHLVKENLHLIKQDIYATLLLLLGMGILLIFRYTFGWGLPGYAYIIL